MTRQQHLNWCKEKALRYVDKNRLAEAWASLISNLDKHPETKDHPAIKTGTQLMIKGKLSTRKKMRDFIEGFN